ncbi:MAG: NADH-quinone oxidoreductase subunit J [Candidatus Omnitrophica bacterium]|nr:NADH-quinone oxidoreductase subunit J [Candidatus Omnitrophota bacterium]
MTHAGFLTFAHALSTVGFYLLAGVTWCAALQVTLTRNLFHSALWLAVTLLGVAGLYLYLGAEFLAVVQVLIYVGAILVLLIFGVMLTARIADPAVPALNRQALLAALAALGVGWALRLAVRQASALPAGPVAAVPLATLGHGLVTTYLLPFEVLSLILVGALVGAIVIAHPERRR